MWLCISAGQLQATNLVVNGDFEQGNTGFTSGYTYSPSTEWPDMVYAVASDPHALNSNWLSYGDHTNGSGTMLIVNGATDANTLVWSETLSVGTNTLYNFSTWVSSCISTYPASLDFVLNGSPAISFNAPAAAGIWEKFTTKWDSGSATSLNIQIFDRNLAFDGNDFALDDISLSPISIFVWQGGNASDPTKWTVNGNWNPNTAVPNGSDTIVSFGNQSGLNNMVDMFSQGQTVGSLSFAATTSTTIKSSNGYGLTLDNNGTVSTIAVAGTHTISAPLMLNNDATMFGTGTLNLTGGISGSHTMKVASGTLSISSITVDTLTIGTIATAVPEPSMLALLGFGFASLSLYARRKR